LPSSFSGAFSGACSGLIASGLSVTMSQRSFREQEIAAAATGTRSGLVWSNSLVCRVSIVSTMKVIVHVRCEHKRSARQRFAPTVQLYILIKIRDTVDTAALSAWWDCNTDSITALSPMCGTNKPLMNLVGWENTNGPATVSLYHLGSNFLSPLYFFGMLKVH
jgi:hypothetical protein